MLVPNTNITTLSSMPDPNNQIEKFATIQDANYASLQNEINFLKEGMRDLKDSLSSLGKEMKERTQIQWSPIIGVIGLVVTLSVGFGAFLFQSVSDTRKDMVSKSDIEQQEKLNNTRWQALNDKYEFIMKFIGDDQKIMLRRR